MENITDGVILLQTNLLDELITTLKQDIPKSLSVLATVHHVACGRLDGKVYTNGWPEFSTVVCQYKGGFSQWFFCCYTSSTKDLCHLLSATSLILSTQKNNFLVESDVADELVKHFKFADVDEVARYSSYILLTSTFYLPRPIKEPCECPEGFVIRKLEEHHTDTVSQSWTHSENLEAKRNHFKSLIKRFHSVGVFSVEDQDTPIAWCMQHPFGQPAHLHVMKKYRRKGFASLVMQHICKCIQDDGLVPETCTEWCNTPAKELMKKLGFEEHQQQKLLSISNNSSATSVF